MDVKQQVISIFILQMRWELMNYSKKQLRYRMHELLKRGMAGG